MSWYNPSQEEATEAYAYYQNKYYNAASQRNASMRQEQAYVSQKSAATTKMNDLSAQKLNFEKRLEGIIKIIKMLEGSGGLVCYKCSKHDFESYINNSKNGY